MNFVGDDDPLRRLIVRLGSVSAAPQAARREMADEAMRRIRAGFEASSSPDGQTWAALKYRRGKPLLLTGRLRNSVRVQLAGMLGFAVSASAPYAAHHQYGAPRARIPARPFLPGRTLPPEWQGAFERILGAHLRRQLGQ